MGDKHQADGVLMSMDHGSTIGRARYCRVSKTWYRDDRDLFIGEHFLAELKTWTQESYQASEIIFDRTDDGLWLRPYGDWAEVEVRETEGQ